MQDYALLKIIDPLQAASFMLIFHSNAC